MPYAMEGGCIDLHAASTSPTTIKACLCRPSLSPGSSTNNSNAFSTSTNLNTASTSDHSCRRNVKISMQGKVATGFVMHARCRFRSSTVRSSRSSTSAVSCTSQFYFPFLRSIIGLLLAPMPAHDYELRNALESESAVKRQMRRLQRELQAAKSRNATREVQERKRQSGASVKAAVSKHTLRESLAGVSAADESNLRSFSQACNARLYELTHELLEPSQRHWMTLFKKVDADGSGLISYDEFMALVRSQLRLSEGQFPSSLVQRMWVSLDTDGDCSISCGEFGAFMRLGEPRGEDERQWREKLAARNHAVAEARRADRAKLFNRDVAQAHKGEEAATDAEVVELASLCGSRIEQM